MMLLPGICACSNELDDIWMIQIPEKIVLCHNVRQIRDAGAVSEHLDCYHGVSKFAGNVECRGRHHLAKLSLS